MTVWAQPSFSHRARLYDWAIYMQRQQASEKRQGTKSRGGEHRGAARAYGDLTGRAVIALMDAEGGLLACLEGWMRESAARPRSREQRRAKGAIGWELLGGGGMMAHRSAVRAPDQRGERMALRC